MNIQKFTSCFHDGGINFINQTDKNLEIWMESSEILPEWEEINILLSANMTIAGKLIIFEVKKIVINDVQVDRINKVHDDCEILKFRVRENEVDLLVIWSNYPPKNQLSKFEHITIYANRIEWKNLPDLFDSF